MRRLQIAEATLQIIARHGVREVTLERIAEAAGISVPAIYRHFESRAEILEAAIGILTQRALAWVESSSCADAIEQLRDLFGSCSDGGGGMDRDLVIISLLEIPSVACEAGLAHSLRNSQLAVLGCVADIIDRGKAEGTIRTDVHAWAEACGLVGLTIARGLALRQGFDQPFTEEASDELLDCVLIGMASSPTLRSVRSD